MCGIVGTFAFGRGETVDRDVLISMRDTMTHRGPDGAGAWFDDNLSVGIGHRRLSIVDLSTTASQPMESDDGRYILTLSLIHI